MKIINTSLEPLPLGKNIALGLAAEYRDDSTCEGEMRILLGSHEPQQAVKVVGGDPPTMAINDNLVNGNPVKPRMVIGNPVKPRNIDNLVIGNPVKPRMVSGTPGKPRNNTKL
jgi:hypothetical protein